MAQFIADEQLDERKVLGPLRRQFSICRIQELRPNEHILDDRIPEILLTLRKPTFITIDQGFWDRRFCNAGYSILCFALRLDQRQLLPELLRDLLRHPEFRTRATRMGKVARIGITSVAFWQFHVRGLRRFAWRESGGSL
jgi:hypothetical protein